MPAFATAFRQFRGAGVEVRVIEQAESMDLSIKYSPDRTAPVYITRMLADFKALLQSVVDHPEARLDELPPKQ